MNTGTFQKKVWQHYRTHKRTLPWRNATNPYHVLLSELMLQQTQVDRVLPKYEAFLKKYPTLTSLKRAALRDVLVLWQGLGYNRRAKFLHQIAKITNGKLPKTYAELIALPGIGHYTAAAIMNFAYGVATPMIETNIRSVYIFFFFKGAHSVDDKEILAVVKRTMDTDDPKGWFNALMDYGLHIKRRVGNVNKKSKHYTKQSKFEGSNREVRGRIIKALTEKPALSMRSLKEITRTAPRQIKENLARLEQEGMIRRKKRSYTLA